ncbi:hypothetical protein WP8S18E11_16060 [Aeromonas veronii]|nr:hypothetical protein WP8S18E11_16060 [Aeromonas veronii]
MVQCAPLIAPYAFPARGEGMVTADDYASLIDPTRPDSPLPIAQASHPHGAWAQLQGLTGKPSRVQPSYLGAGAGVRLDAVIVATAPDCRYQIAPLTIDHEKGANRRRWISYGFIERLTMAAITQLSETRGFFALAHTFRNGCSINGCRGWVLAGRWGNAAREGAITLI